MVTFLEGKGDQRLKRLVAISRETKKKVMEKNKERRASGRLKLDEAQPGGKREEEMMEKKEERRASEMAQSFATKWSATRWSRAPSLTIENCASIHSHDKLHFPDLFSARLASAKRRNHSITT